MLAPLPTIVLYRHGDDRHPESDGFELCRVSGLVVDDRGNDVPWFMRELNLALDERIGRIAETPLVAHHVDAPSSFCRPIGTGPLPGVEIKAFARQLAEVLVPFFRAADGAAA